MVYNEEVPGGTNPIQTRSDRKIGPSQQPPLLSPLPSFLLALHLHLWLGPSGVRAVHIRLEMSVCLRESGAAMYPVEEHERHSLSPHHEQAQNTEGDTVLCFCGCLDCLGCSLQALAGVHSSLAVRIQRRDGHASAQLNSNSCLLPRAMGWLCVVFPKLYYQKFNNSKSILLLLMCVSVTKMKGTSRGTTIHARQMSFIMLDGLIKRNQLSQN